MVGLSPFRPKFSQDLIQADNTDLCIIGKVQRMPANCRRRDLSSIFSPLLFIE